MPSPLYRRPARPLSQADVDRLVALREGGATWREIGRAFAKQDSVCKAIFDKARAGPQTEGSRTMAEAHTGAAA